MELIKEGKKWILKGTRYEDRRIPSAARFRWDPSKRQWWTDKIDRAAKLIQYASGDVKDELNAQAKKLEESRELSRATDAVIDVPKPEGLEYLPYQRAGIAYGLDRPNVLIADEMGLGKTIQALGIINADPTIKSALIIVPASLRINWYREANKWLVRDYTIDIADGDDFPEADIVIINYERLGKHREAIRARQWDIYVCDEAHYIKNAKAQRTKEIIGEWDRKKNGWKITPLQARRKVMLTGTPILNRPVELWNLLRLLDKDRWTNFMSFAKRYCDAKHNGFGWDFGGANPKTLPELQEILRETIMVRRLKKDVLKELPPKRRQVIELPANGMLRFVNKEAEAWDPYEEKIARLQAKVELAKASEDDQEYYRAVQELSDEVEAAFDELSELRYDTAMSKVPHVINHVKETLESTDKVIVFAHHHDMVDALADSLGNIAVRVTGKEGMEERQAAVDRFQQDPSCQVFLGTIGAAGVGLTLTAASVVVFAELDWTPGRMTQAEDRAHRIGQENSVLIQYLVVDGSIDAKMAHLIVAKQDIIDRALDVEVEEKEEIEEPLAPVEVASAGTRRKQIAREAVTITEEQIQAVHEALNILASMDQDRAQERNDMGFSGADTHIGHELARQPYLTPRQAVLGRKIVRKYHRQVGWDLLEQMGLKRPEKKKKVAAQ